MGDDVELYTDESRREVRARFHFLRQQVEKAPGQPYFCLADFVAPRDGGQPGAAPLPDHLGAFAVTTGGGLKELIDSFRKDHDDYNIIMAESLIVAPGARITRLIPGRAAN